MSAPPASTPDWVKIFPIKKDGPIVLPSRQTEASAGLDLSTPVQIVLEPYTQVVIPLGFCLMPPKGYFGLICSRSGLALKHGVYAFQGVIDGDYTGQLCVGLENRSSNRITIENGNRIAQIIILPLFLFECRLVDELPETGRGAGGFGSTGGTPKSESPNSDAGWDAKPPSTENPTSIAPDTDARLDAAEPTALHKDQLTFNTKNPISSIEEEEQQQQLPQLTRPPNPDCLSSGSILDEILDPRLTSNRYYKEGEQENGAEPTDNNSNLNAIPLPSGSPPSPTSNKRKRFDRLASNKGDEDDKEANEDEEGEVEDAEAIKTKRSR